MRTKTKCILAFNGNVALDFSMMLEQLHGFELSECFDYEVSLGFVSKTIANSPYYESIIERPGELLASNIEFFEGLDNPPSEDWVYPNN